MGYEIDFELGDLDLFHVGPMVNIMENDILMNHWAKPKTYVISDFYKYAVVLAVEFIC